MEIFIAAAVFAAFIFIFIIFIGWSLWGRTYETPRARAGRQGEEEAAEIIKQVLHKNDVLLTNVCVKYQGKMAELDNVIINGSGVFVIEVKNYSGTMMGGEEDYEWTKYKTSRGGNIYEKQVRNPIKQVRRQVYILSKFLKQHRMNVWIDGYVLFVNNNSPVHCDMVLESFQDIERAVHGRPKHTLSEQNRNRLKEMLL